MLAEIKAKNLTLTFYTTNMEPTTDELNKSLNKLMSESSTPLTPDPRETAPEIKNSIAKRLESCKKL